MPSLGERWRVMSPWTRAFLQAMVLLILVHTFVLRWVIVQSTSMFATLVPGDVVAVQRWPVWTGFQRGDVAVFRDPAQDDVRMGRRQLLVKRIVGLPGDTVRIRNGHLFVNGMVLGPWPGQTQRYLVRLKAGADAVQVAHAIGLPEAYLLRNDDHLEVPLNRSLAALVEALPGVRSVAPMGLSLKPARHLFPFSPIQPWSTDAYGPIRIPAEGDTVNVNVGTLPLYDRIMTRYEGHSLEVAGNTLLLDSEPLERYVIGQDHYFVLGDSRHNSADSRHWGFVPADHLVGRAQRVLLSLDSERHALRWERTLQGVAR